MNLASTCSSETMETRLQFFQVEKQNLSSLITLATMVFSLFKISTGINFFKKPLQ